jgi:putative ABC transport system ATP-binding protein
MVIDPVCRMQVEPTGPHTTWQGEQWWFCSEACRHEFLARPERFAVGHSDA